MDQSFDANYQARKFFISGINSLVGYTLFELLRNDDVAIVNDQQPNKFVGSMLDNGSPNPSPTIKPLDLQKKPRTFQKHIISCDVIILNLVDSQDTQEAEFVIKTLKQQEAEKNQTLILLSSLTQWSRSVRKQRNVADRPVDSDLEEGEEQPIPSDESDCGPDE
jgi:hypothetical protein